MCIRDRVRAAVLERAATVLDSMPHAQREFMILSGDVRDAQGDLERAKADYKLALVSQPNDPETRLKLAMVLVDLGQTEEALEVAEDLKSDGGRNSAYNKFMKYLNNGNRVR